MSNTIEVDGLIYGEHMIRNLRIERDQADSDRTRLADRCRELEGERESASVSSSSGDSTGMTNNELLIKLQLSETREKQATEMCTWLTAENQRLRDLAALTKHIDDDIDEMLDDAEEDCVARVIAESAHSTALQRIKALEGMLGEAVQIGLRNITDAHGYGASADRLRLTEIAQELPK